MHSLLLLLLLSSLLGATVLALPVVDADDWVVVDHQEPPERKATQESSSLAVGDNWEVLHNHCDESHGLPASNNAQDTKKNKDDPLEDKPQINMDGSDADADESDNNHGLLPTSLVADDPNENMGCAKTSQLDDDEPQAPAMDSMGSHVDGPSPLDNEDQQASVMDSMESQVHGPSRLDYDKPPAPVMDSVGSQVDGPSRLDDEEPQAPVKDSKRLRVTRTPQIELERLQALAMDLKRERQDQSPSPLVSLPVEKGLHVALGTYNPSNTLRHRTFSGSRKL